MTVNKKQAIGGLLMCVVVVLFILEGVSESALSARGAERVWEEIQEHFKY